MPSFLVQTVQGPIFCTNLRSASAFRMVDEGQAILLVLLLYPLSSNCMLEELKAGLGGAKAYLDSLLPIINDGIKAVQVSNHRMPQEADFEKKHAEV